MSFSQRRRSDMEVKVNDGEWNGLNEEDKIKIQAIIQAYFHGTTVVSHKNLPPSADAIQTRIPSFNFKNPICNAACGVSEAAAVAACSALSGGVAIAVCVAAAHAAGDYCRSRC
jgi:hypothetical protein